jgi:hypothetical protein
MKANIEKATDFAGFINGFQASNLETIQRNIALQLSEMQTRLSVIKAQIPNDLPGIEPAILRIDGAFRDASGTIVDRLVTVGQQLTSILIMGGNKLKEHIVFLDQFVKLIRVYVDAAEISRNERMVDAAIQVAEALDDLKATVTEA